MKKLFLLIPAAIPSGPVKGAYALANALAGKLEIEIVTLRSGAGAEAYRDPRVQFRCLEFVGRTSERIRYYRRLLLSHGGVSRVTSLSMCLSADLANAFACGAARIISSVRGNLFENYGLDYGPLGYPLAAGHLLLLRSMDCVVTMTPEMARQVQRFSRKNVAIAPNFVDENALEPFRVARRFCSELRFVFIGSLTERKRPLLVIEAFARLIMNGVSARLYILGDGPLRSAVLQRIVDLQLSELIHFNGFQSVPYAVLADADALVLPSLSEGVSRASLEALYLGVPCVLRDVDGNHRLIEEGENGALFDDDESLDSAMLRAASLSRKNEAIKSNLLPEEFRQERAISAYCTILA